MRTAGLLDMDRSSRAISKLGPRARSRKGVLSLPALLRIIEETRYQRMKVAERGDKEGQSKREWV